VKPQRAQRLERLVDAAPKYVYEAGASARAGISFDCPIHGDGCRVAVPFANPPDGPPGAWAASREGGWHRDGDSFEAMTLSPSIHVTGEKHGPDRCEWHGFIRAGRFEHCDDSR